MSYHNLSAQEVPSLLAQPDVVVLDTRDPATFARAHIEGAQRAEQEVVGTLVRRRKENPPVLVYCYHGNSSRELASFLSGLGLTQVYNLEGGWQAWETWQMRRSASLSDATLAWATQHGFDPADLNGRIVNGTTMLMAAATHGRHDTVLELLQAGADPNVVNDDGNNALWFACYSAEPACLRSLIEHGTELDNQNVNGATCLIYAASAGKFDVVKILVESGADLECATHDGFNALDSAATLPVLKFLRPRYAAA